MFTVLVEGPWLEATWRAAHMLASPTPSARRCQITAGPAIEPEANRVVLVGGRYSTHKIPGHGRGGFVLALVLAALVALVFFCVTFSFTFVPLLPLFPLSPL